MAEASYNITRAFQTTQEIVTTVKLKRNFNALETVWRYSEAICVKNDSTKQVMLRILFRRAVFLRPGYN